MVETAMLEKDQVQASERATDFCHLLPLHCLCCYGNILDVKHFRCFFCLFWAKCAICQSDILYMALITTTVVVCRFVCDFLSALQCMPNCFCIFPRPWCVRDKPWKRRRRCRMRSAASWRRLEPGPGKRYSGKRSVSTESCNMTCPEAEVYINTLCGWQ